MPQQGQAQQIRIPTRSQSEENEIWLTAMPQRPAPPIIPTWALFSWNSSFSWYITADMAAKVKASAVTAVQLPRNRRPGRMAASAMHFPHTLF